MKRAFHTASIGFMSTIIILMTFAQLAHSSPEIWQREWPNTDFAKSSVDYDEIKSGGPPKDGIPSIDNPVFEKARTFPVVKDHEPVIGLVINGEEKAYSLSVLMWHEIVNDTVGGIPVAVTFCPLCNSAIVFDRRVNGKAVEFGTTGKLRHSDMVMYDRDTESWWQQFEGRAILGAHLDYKLDVIPSRLESFGEFKQRTGEEALILVPNDPSMRRYGYNPYVRYDSGQPFLFRGQTPQGIKPLARVVSFENRTHAYSLDFLRQKQNYTTEDGITLTWTAGQASALDSSFIADGKDVGTIIAQKNGKDIVYFMEFAFAFHAFHPDAPIHGLE